MEGDTQEGQIVPYRGRNFDHEDESLVDRLPEEERGRFDRVLEPPPGEGSGAGFEEHFQDEVTGETDFASLKFQRENTLLTNADLYADSIRNEAELYVRQIREEVDHLNSEAEKRYEEASQVKSQSTQQAQELVAKASAEAQQIRDDAHNAGFSEGKQAGAAKRYEEAGPMLERIGRILEMLKQYRRQTLHYAERDSVRLALLLARKVLHQELKINRKAVLKLLASTMSSFKGTGNFTVWLNPEDHQFALAARPALEKYLKEGQGLTLRAQANLEPGNLLIETDREIIDSTFESQFHHMDSLLNQMLEERQALASAPVTFPQATQDATASQPAASATASQPAASAASEQLSTASADAPAAPAIPETPSDD